MVQAMAVVAADASVEGKRHAPCVVLEGQCAEQFLALRKDGNGGVQNTPGVVKMVIGNGEV